MNSDELKITLILLTGAAIIVGIVLQMSFKSKRRARLFRKEFPRDYQLILNQHVALYSLLPVNLKDELHGRIMIFLDEKEFEGCGGLKVDLRMKVTIAAFACMLLLNKKFDYYPKLNSILLYPDAYIAENTKSNFAGMMMVQKESARLGESWNRGNLVLSWQQIADESESQYSRQNVILHEFAHQLDQLDGYADGTPPLADKAFYAEWHNVMEAEYKNLCEEAEHAIRDVINWYGATNPAEFFAVTTEAFFCDPISLEKAHRKLYDLFVMFYKVDPALWHKKSQR